MRPGVALVLACGILLYLVIAVWRFQTGTRLAGVADVVVFSVLYTPERRCNRLR